MNPFDMEGQVNGARAPGNLTVHHIARVTRVVSDITRASRFYCDALGFRVASEGPLDERTKAAFGLESVSAHEVVLRLGQQEIALVVFRHAGLAYPNRSHSDDLWFQHLAIVVSDMDRAYAHLCAFHHWQPISLGGPQLLPTASGGVRAFKFRDLDGHPLELLRLPSNQLDLALEDAADVSPFLGIDHSAISVSSTRHSLGFYETLGFSATHVSSNQGAAQSRLDGLRDASVRVTRLDPEPSNGVGLELLAYRPPGRAGTLTRVNDRVTDWMTLGMSHPADNLPRSVQDPDHHRLLLVYQGPDEMGTPP
jgi:catechol 2,3-dioxygenase-like lactoylglutathione lyase family enzyme